MIRFTTTDLATFLREYWQKKPMVFRQAIPDFDHPISADELAGLALEDELESRIVIQNPGTQSNWQLKRGPFKERDFKKLPASHWTLLVQGVDRFVPEVAELLTHFNFIPRWRIDDVMISYAVEQGSVGPHYDNYDVFLYQAKGRRKWCLTSQHCTLENYLTEFDLRIMNNFVVEEAFILEEGDMLYLPPHIGHHGISLSSDCMTYSFGYRSYQAQELWDSFGEYLAEHAKIPDLYKDPAWLGLTDSAELPQSAASQAKIILQKIIDDEPKLQTWFGCFATQIDQQAEQLLPLPDDNPDDSQALFLTNLASSQGLQRNYLCRFAYQMNDESGLALFINGSNWNSQGISDGLIKLVANQTSIDLSQLQPYLNQDKNQQFLYELWQLQWINFMDE